MCAACARRCQMVKVLSEFTFQRWLFFLLSRLSRQSSSKLPYEIVLFFCEWNGSLVMHDHFWLGKSFFGTFYHYVLFFNSRLSLSAYYSLARHVCTSHGPLNVRPTSNFVRRYCMDSELILNSIFLKICMYFFHVQSPNLIP